MTTFSNELLEIVRVDQSNFGRNSNHFDPTCIDRLLGVNCGADFPFRRAVTVKNLLSVFRLSKRERPQLSLRRLLGLDGLDTLLLCSVALRTNPARTSFIVYFPRTILRTPVGPAFAGSFDGHVRIGRGSPLPAAT